jgi:hypothetical protein
MRLPRKDIIATILVGVAGVLYVLWATESALPGMSGPRATGMVILGLGFAASASAVVPGFEDLLHGSKAYLAVTSLLGLLAFAAGVQLLVTASEVALGAVMAAMVVLWLIATVHHSLRAEAAPTTRQRATSSPRQGPWATGVS